MMARKKDSSCVKSHYTEKGETWISGENELQREFFKMYKA